VKGTPSAFLARILRILGGTYSIPSEKPLDSQRNLLHPLRETSGFSGEPTPSPPRNLWIPRGTYSIPSEKPLDSQRNLLQSLRETCRLSGEPIGDRSCSHSDSSLVHQRRAHIMRWLQRRSECDNEAGCAGFNRFTVTEDDSFECARRKLFHRLVRRWHIW
jgi:hypothetical protein